jgi:hypothetical protein
MSGWGEDWSEDVDRTYQAPPPAGMTDFDLALYWLLASYSSRGGIIPSQETLARELGVSVPTIKRSVRRLKAAGWLKSWRRPQRNVKRGGRLEGGNRYHLKVSLNDLDAGLFPQVATRDHAIPTGHNEGSRPKAAKPQVATRDHDGARSLGGGGKAKHQPSSQRGISPVDKRPSAPTVSESKPVQERVSPQLEVELSSAPGGRRFGSMAEKKAWVAAQRRAGHPARPVSLSARMCKQQELDREARGVVLAAWAGEEGPVAGPAPMVDDDVREVLMMLERAGMLEGSQVVELEVWEEAPLPAEELDPAEEEVRPVERHVGLDVVLEWSNIVQEDAAA